MQVPVRAGVTAAFRRPGTHSGPAFGYSETKERMEYNMFAKKTLAILSVMAISTAFLPFTTALAVMYKWVDEEGNVQYSERRPPGKAEIVKPPPKVDTEAAREALRERQEKLDKTRTEKKEAGSEASREKHDATVTRKNCDIASERLQQLSTGYTAATDEQGNRVRMSEEQRQTKIKQAREEMQKYCNKGG